MSAQHDHVSPARYFVGILLLALLASTSSCVSGAGDTNAQARHNTTDDGSGSGGPNDPLGGPKASSDEDGPVAPVPEPGTMALAGMGLVALGAVYRKYKRS